MIFYAAYGSNLNLKQMKSRCPNSKPFGKIILNDWRLVFKGVADLEKKMRNKALLGIYKITNACEKKLDMFEEYPTIYKKITFNQIIKGENKKIMMYVMNDKFDYAVPTEKYFSVIKKGYQDWDFNLAYLKAAGSHSLDNNSLNGYKSKNWVAKNYINYDLINNFNS